MTISTENRALLERKLGRSLPDISQKVTLTVAALAQIVESARREEQAKAETRKPQTEEDRLIADAKKISPAVGAAFEKILRGYR